MEYEDLHAFLDDVGREELVPSLAAEPLERARAGDLEAARALGRALWNCRRTGVRRALFACLKDIGGSAVREAVVEGLEGAPRQVLEELGREDWPELQRLRPPPSPVPSAPQEVQPGDALSWPSHVYGVWLLSDKVGVAVFTGPGLEICQASGNRQVPDRSVDCLALAPTGGVIALSGSSGDTFFQAQGEAAPPVRHRDSAKALLFMPDGAHLLKVRGARLECVRVADRRPVWSRSFFRVTRRDTPEYERLALTDTFFDQLKAREVPIPITSLAVSPDGSRVAVVTCDGKTRLLAGESGVTREEHQDVLPRVRFSRDGRLLLVERQGVVVEGRRFSTSAPVADCAVSPEGAVLLALGDGGLLSLDLEHLKPCELFRGGVATALAPNGTRAARLTTKSLQIFDSAGATVREFPVEELPEKPRLRFSDDGSLVLLEAAQGPYVTSFRLWSVREGPLGIESRPPKKKAPPRLEAGDPLEAAHGALQTGRRLGEVLEGLAPRLWEPLLRRLQLAGFWPVEEDLEIWRRLSTLDQDDWLHLRGTAREFHTEVPPVTNRLRALLELVSEA